METMGLSAWAAHLDPAQYSWLPGNPANEWAPDASQSITQSAFLSGNTCIIACEQAGVTHLDPINNAGNVTGLQQELLSLHADADHMAPLHVVAPQAALGVMQCIRV